ncbi:MAG: phosphoribosylglycinamide formyltransferase [Peptostreptococcus sp.]|uniref:phosphoribosylglycinamide formyltransferase n=1 Tax=Peptostreptococcus sp. TaxID=1262 RepID=UPI002FC9E20A
MKNIAVLVSGGGTNLQSIIDAVESGKINGRIKLVISNKKDAYGLKRAEKHNIRSKFDNDEDSIIESLMSEEIDLVVLAGFLKILSSNFTKTFENKIINIHPSLIPAFCGVGYYGLNVHKAAVDYGVKISGATVHFVDENADTGPIIAQEVVEVLPDDTAETLQNRVLEVEHSILPMVVEKYCDDKIEVKGRRVYIK